MSEIDVRRPAPITQRASAAFDSSQVAVIRDTVARDCSEPEFRMFLEIAARLDLNPFVGEIWAAKMPGKNGSSGRVSMIVGRDGFIKIANRSPDYRGIDGDVVRKNDLFKVSRTAAKRTVKHEYGGSAEDRGPIVGAWAMVFREGHATPYYFYAPLDEYKPKPGPKLQYSPWGSQESVMILKCAQATALRLAFNVSGVYSEGELAQAMAHEAPLSGPEIDWGDDPELAERLRALVDRANEVRPGSYKPARLAMLLTGTTHEERVALAEAIEAFIAAATSGFVAVDGSIREAV